jgi:dihydrofolate reductase
MGKVFADISVSLDGFVAGPNPSIEDPLGEGGERLHEWVLELASWREPHGLAGGITGPDDEVMKEAFENVGAVVMGRRMFGGGDGEWGDPAWGDQPWEGWWGDDPPFHAPVFVLTHHAREPLAKQGGTTFTFVTEGIESAVEQAREAAGDKDVWVAGGADVVQQSLRAGLLDEIQIHVAPILLGGGTRLFDDLVDVPIQLEKTRVIDSPDVTHLKYRVSK